MTEIRSRIIISVLAVLGMIIISTIGFHFIEGWPLFTALWMTVVSLTTTGYGDLIPVSVAGKLFAMVVLLFGIGMVLYTMGTVISALVDRNLARFMERDKMMDAIKQLENHVIVCGGGRVGSNAAHVLSNYQVPYVLIEIEESLVHKAEEEGHLVLQGDATRDEILIKAGIQKARGIICALSSDTQNVFVVLTARALNPNLRIVARSLEPETIAKLRQAGADKVISPTQIGGNQMAMAMIKPAAVEMVNTLFAFRNLEIQLEEVEIKQDSWLANKQIKDAFDRKVNNIMVAAILRGDQVIMNPHGRDVLQSGDTLVLIGSRQDLDFIDFSLK